MAIFKSPIQEQFLNRRDDLTRLEQWWSRSDRFLALYGRRRVGKSWLFRAFADGKEAVILVAREVAEAQSLAEFAEALEPHLGIRPQLDSLSDLVRALFRAARDKKLLVVIDEFPRLLPSSATQRITVLQAVAAVIEQERDSSQLKLILCGSHISMMESLLEQEIDGRENPVRGRVESLPLRPLSFWEAREFLPDAFSSEEAITRFAVTGGTPLYLRELGQGDLGEDLCRDAISPRSQFFNEPRDILTQEVRETRVYFSILEALASGQKPLDKITGAVKRDSTLISQYLDNLDDLKLIEKRRPVGADPSSRNTAYRLRDPFYRFWFRFVFPFQEDLEAGLAAEDHFTSRVLPELADHVAPAFEEISMEWSRKNYGTAAQQWGAWWGNALNELRKDGSRTSEEIDIVGLKAKTATVIGECRWRTDLMDVNILNELEKFKLPALEQAGFKVSKTRTLLLFSKAGYTDGLKKAAAKDTRIRLVSLNEL